jgi:hypothetical protein
VVAFSVVVDPKVDVTTVDVLSEVVVWMVVSVEVVVDTVVVDCSIVLEVRVVVTTVEVVFELLSVDLFSTSVLLINPILFPTSEV